VQFRQVELGCLIAIFKTTATTASQLDCSSFSTFVWVEPTPAIIQFLASFGRLLIVEAA